MASIENKELTFPGFLNKLEDLYLNNNEDNRNKITKDQVYQLAKEISLLNKDKKPYFFITFYNEIKNTDMNDIFKNGSVDQGILGHMLDEVEKKIEKESKTNQILDAEKPNLQVVEQNEITQEEIKDKLEKMDFSNLSINDTAFLGRHIAELSDDQFEKFVKVLCNGINNEELEKDINDILSIIRETQMGNRDKVTSGRDKVNDFINKYQIDIDDNISEEELPNYLYDNIFLPYTNIPEEIQDKISVNNVKKIELTDGFVEEWIKELETPKYDNMFKIFQLEGGAREYVYSLMIRSCEELKIGLPPILQEYIEKHPEKYESTRKKVEDNTKSIREVFEEQDTTGLSDIVSNFMPNSVTVEETSTDENDDRFSLSEYYDNIISLGDLEQNIGETSSFESNNDLDTVQDENPLEKIYEKYVLSQNEDLQGELQEYMNNHPEKYESTRKGVDDNTKSIREVFEEQDTTGLSDIVSKFMPNSVTVEETSTDENDDRFSLSEYFNNSSLGDLEQNIGETSSFESNNDLDTVQDENALEEIYQKYVLVQNEVLPSESHYNNSGVINSNVDIEGYCNSLFSKPETEFYLGQVTKEVPKSKVASNTLYNINITEQENNEEHNVSDEVLGKEDKKSLLGRLLTRIRESNNKDRFGIKDINLISKGKGIRNSLIDIGEDVMDFISAIGDKIKNSFDNIGKIVKLNSGDAKVAGALPPVNPNSEVHKTFDEKYKLPNPEKYTIPVSPGINKGNSARTPSTIGHNNTSIEGVTTYDSQDDDFTIG